jgi:hypothetical protein
MMTIYLVTARRNDEKRLLAAAGYLVDAEDEADALAVVNEYLDRHNQTHWYAATASTAPQSAGFTAMAQSIALRHTRH